MNAPDGAALASANGYQTNSVTLIMEPCAVLLLTRSNPQPGERVIDVAAGTGVVARLVAPMVGPAGRVVAVDVNPAMLAVGRAKPAPAGAAIEWQEGAAQELPQPSAEFDLAMCQHGVQYFSDCPAALREMRRVLRPDGRAAISVWGPMEQNPACEPMWVSIARHVGVAPKTMTLAFKWHNAAELRSMVEGAGFRKVSISPCSLVVRQPYDPRYLAGVVAGVRKLLPTLDAMTDEDRAAMVQAVNDDVAPAVRPLY